MSEIVIDAVEVEELTQEQGQVLFDRESRKELGVSGDEFLAAYRAGALPQDWSPEALCRLELLLPMAR